MSTLEILNEVFRDVFSDNTLSIAMETTANDIEEWDSLTHINLILAIEAKFKVRFSQNELFNQRNVGDLVADIDRQLSA